MPVDNKAELMQRDGKLTSRKSLRENLLGIIQRTCEQINTSITGTLQSALNATTVSSIN
ncbi:hypothetical protein PVAP13_7NG375300 [Panicum virgatum]|uniref:Uncharacterized protein n=1 Tax=Panicum virgatum TaxID=38727 RepID=A0A8T0Q5S3_PANVG|nr:hypothetical protein PVAP13_7NG375300 [Panicum virgatum]